MTIKIYVNHCEENILTEKDFFERIVCNKTKSIKENPEAFSEWIDYNKNLSSAEVFYLKEEEKEKIKQEYEQYAHNRAIADLGEEGWDLVQLKI